jgi:hypothetical protein
MPLTLFALVILQIRSCVYAQAGRVLDPSIYASCIAEITGVHHTQLLLVEIGSLKLFTQADFKPKSS